MSNTALSRAAYLVSSLTPQEKAIIVSVINATRNPHSAKSKLLELLYELENDSNSTKMPNRKLAELLEDRILDCLIMDVNILRAGKYKNNSYIFPILLKESIKSQLLHNKGIVDRAYQIAENCINHARETENFDVILTLLHQQASMICIHQNEVSYFEKISEIDYYENCRSIKIRAERLYRELSIKKYYGILDNLDLFIESGLRQLYHFQAKVSLTVVDFIIKYFEKEKHELEGNIFSSLEVTINLYGKWLLLTGHSLIYNIYELVYEQARLCYELDRKRETIFLLHQCIKNLPVENTACLKSFELLFLIQYLDKEHLAARKTLMKIRQSNFYEKTMPLRIKSRWVYYEACLCFSTGEFKKCIHVLTTARAKGFSDLNKIRLRFLTIMAYIELEYLDMADKQIESTRKFIERNHLSGILQESGLYYFFGCLTALRYCGYDFTILPSRMPELQKNLNALKSRKLLNTQLNSWLIEYGVWIRRKLEPTIVNSDFLRWHVGRREHYYDTGMVKRVTFP